MAAGVFDGLDFGVAGTDGNDNSSALRCAVPQAAAEGCRTIWLPAGVCEMDVTFVCSSLAGSSMPVIGRKGATPVPTASALLEAGSADAPVGDSQGAGES
jgi:hypothetical protein